MADDFRTAPGLSVPVPIDLRPRYEVRVGDRLVRLEFGDHMPFEGLSPEDADELQRMLAERLPAGTFDEAWLTRATAIVGECMAEIRERHAKIESSSSRTT